MNIPPGMSSMRKLRFLLYRGPAILKNRLLQSNPGKSARQSLNGVEDHFDSDWGVETSSVVRLIDLFTIGRNDVHGNRYEPTDATDFDGIMEGLRIHPEEFVFVDLGSGKGRVLLLASQYNFKKVVGVEFAPALAALCRANLAKARKRPICEIEVLCMDALDYNFPPDNLILYIYNPFDATILRKLLTQLERSLQRVPRTIVLIYRVPQEAKVLDGCSFLKLKSRNRATAVYRTFHERCGSE